MSNLSAKSMSELGNLIKTAEVRTLELSYTGPGLAERLAEVDLTQPLHKVINAVLRDHKGRTSKEIHEIIKDRGFSEQDVRTCMQNIYKRKLVVVVPSEDSRIAYRIAGRGEFWPEDIMSPTPTITPTMAAKLARDKAKAKDLPKFDTSNNPMNIQPTDQTELAIWKLMQDGRGRRMPEINEALEPFQFTARSVKNTMQRLIQLRWFEFSKGHSTVVYTLKKGVPMPSASGKLTTLKPEVELPTLENGRLVLDLQKDGIRRTIHKIMSDGLKRTNVELAEILAPMCDSTHYLKYEMMQLVKFGWFDREETSHPVGHYPIIVYKLKADVRRPAPEAITPTSKFYKMPGRLETMSNLNAIHAALSDGQSDPTAMFAVNPQASLLPAAPSALGDLSIAQGLGMGSNVSAGAREALSRGLGGITSNGIIPETTGVSLKDPVIEAIPPKVVITPDDGLAMAAEIREKTMAAIAQHAPLVEVCVKIAGKSITTAQADEIVDELGDLGFGDERNMIQSKVIKVKLELAGTEFCLEDVDKIVKTLKEKGFGKHHKN